jgi:rSAM/selenodomain-associated transferase 1
MDPVPILLFAKAPVPGRVKTRLIPVLGAEGAARLTQELAATCIAAAVASRTGPVSLWGTPDCLHPFFARMSRDHGVELRTQEGRDLGERMDHALSVSLNQHAAVLLAGTDLCHPTPRLFRTAAELLTRGTAEAVLVPSVDGGYVLIGLRKPCPQLFRDLDWGTEGVCAETLRRMDAQALTCRLLPPERDLDTAADYALWAGEKSGTSGQEGRDPV